MNNVVISSMFEEFCQKNSFSSSENENFESFVSFSIFNGNFNDSFNFDKVSTGKLVGIDSIAIAINDVIVDNPSEALTFTTGSFDACFHFIQAKTSSSLDLGDYLKFINTIIQFFDNTIDTDSLPPELQKFHEIKKIIYKKASKFKNNVKPSIKIYYVYTGNGKFPQQNFKTQIETSISNIDKNKEYTSEIKNYLIGADKLATYYKECLNQTIHTLMLQKNFSLPNFENSTSSYIGVVKCLDYIKLLKKDNGEINKRVFNDNVRDFLGNKNPVNQKIAETIRNQRKKQSFAVLNNGITLVAKRVTPSGDRFELEGLQIVNGCQTSHVLFNNEKYFQENDNSCITIKIIETSDTEITNNIIESTNKQSIVPDEAFTTIKPYHKKIEDFFNAMQSHDYQLYYERRPHQFDEDENVKNKNIATAPTLIQSFISVIHEEPHKVHYYYGQILKDYNSSSGENSDTSIKKNIFHDSHNPAIYFIGFYIFSKVREKNNQPDLKKWNFHISLMIKKIIGININPTQISDKQAMEILRNINEKFDSAYNESFSIIKKSSFLERDAQMLPKYTTELITKVLFPQNKLASNASKIKDGTLRCMHKGKTNDNKLVFKYGDQLHEYDSSVKEYLTIGKNYTIIIKSDEIIEII